MWVACRVRRGSSGLTDQSREWAALDGVYGVFLMLTMMTGAHITAEGIAAEDRRGKVAKMFSYLNERPDEPLDLVALRADYPKLMDLATWLRETNWKP